MTSTAVACVDVQGYDDSTSQYRVRFIDPSLLPCPVPSIAVSAGVLHTSGANTARSTAQDDVPAVTDLPSGAVTEKWVGRLNLRFDAEKGWLFEARRAAAIAKREKCKEMLRSVSTLQW